MKQVTTVKNAETTSAAKAMASLTEKQQDMLNDYLDTMIEQLYLDDEARALMVACTGVYDSRVSIRMARNAGSEDTPAKASGEYLRSMLREVFALMCKAAV